MLFLYFIKPGLLRLGTETHRCTWFRVKAHNVRPLSVLEILFSKVYRKARNVHFRIIVILDTIFNPVEIDPSDNTLKYSTSRSCFVHHTSVNQVDGRKVRSEYMTEEVEKRHQHVWDESE